MCAAFLGAALWAYAPALDGPFVSDDNHYVQNNVYVHGLSAHNLAAILDPTGAATVAVVNYAPVQLLLHAGAWSVFGDDVRGHHVVNVVLHVLASLLLMALFLRTGIARAPALLGGACFLLHPANVEAVAWISQLKSSAALVLALAALLACPRRPLLATGCFALALLAKPTAAVALPVAAVLAWTRGERMPWGWLGLWALAFAGFAVAEFSVHQRSGAAEATLYETPVVLARTIAALALRYLAMAGTLSGLSAFHEPEPIHSFLDPRWLAAPPVLALLGWRAFHTWRRRSPELAYWIWAAVSFGPVSQIFPFLYPLADRYLYFILPGLIGAVLLAGREAQGALAARSGPTAALRVRCAAVALGVVFVGLAGVRANQRASIWRSPALLVADAAAHYPNGVSAQLLRAKRAAQQGDVDGAVAGVRAATARGYNRFEQLLADEGFAPVQRDPRFQSLVREIALQWIESGRRKRDPTQAELRRIAHAHFVRAEYADAEVALERALAVGGPRDDEVRRELSELRTLEY